MVWTKRPYSSREFIREMGKYLKANGKKADSLVLAAYERDVPIFCPAFSDSSAGFGLVKHQVENPDAHVSIDSVKDFRELTEIKIQSPVSGLFMIGGGVPKNFAQDTVICAEVLGHEVDMHKYAVQITVADVRDGACSSSTLKEASSWGKVDTTYEQMVFAEATVGAAFDRQLCVSQASVAEQAPETVEQNLRTGAGRRAQMTRRQTTEDGGRLCTPIPWKRALRHGLHSTSYASVRPSVAPVALVLLLLGRVQRTVRLEQAQQEAREAKATVNKLNYSLKTAAEEIATAKAELERGPAGPR